MFNICDSHLRISPQHPPVADFCTKAVEKPKVSLFRLHNFSDPEVGTQHLYNYAVILLKSFDEDIDPNNWGEILKLVP